MHYYSLNHQSPPVDFREATIAGQAPDKGLYFPSAVPTHASEWIRDIAHHSDVAIGVEVMRPYTAGSLPDKVLEQIVAETLSFPIPLVPVTEHIFSLELFHGPTLAFKDIGARFMSRCLGYFLRETQRKVVVLVATSGDTGGAVAHGFHQVPGIDVVILYPSGKVSAVQEAQITGPGDNIHALRIDGSFDHCQALVKQAFADGSLRQQLFLTSANSINVARWLPQQLYYFLAWKQWSYKEAPPLIAVPSGNFGNISSGILAQLSGVPAAGFVAACNANATVPDYLTSGRYLPRQTRHTLSNAMDVSDPSNFVRLLALFRDQYPLVREALQGYSISDEATTAAMEQVYAASGYRLDPHGAVGYIALQQALEQRTGMKGIFLETAHPSKFGATAAMQHGPAEQPTGNSIPMAADYNSLKEYLLRYFNGQ